MIEAALRPEILHISNTSAVDEAGTTRWLRERFTQYRVLPNNTMEAFTDETLMVRTGPGAVWVLLAA